jgi:hypothetical protein
MSSISFEPRGGSYRHRLDQMTERSRLRAV